MKPISMLSTALLALVGVAGAAGAAEVADTLPLDQIPAEVRATIEREAQGAAVSEVERDLEDGRVVYEVKVQQSGLDRRFTVGADGALMNGRPETPKLEEQSPSNGDHLTLADLPEPARAVIETRTAGSEISSIHRVINDGRETYEVRVRKDGLDQRLTVGADGAVIADRDLKPGDDSGRSSGSQGSDDDAWQDTKEGTKKAWDKTKEGSGKAWDKTKQVGSGAWTDARTALDDDGVTLETVPKAVADTIRAEAGSNAVQDIDVDAKHGKIWYEAEIRVKDGRNRSITVAEDGSLMDD